MDFYDELREQEKNKADYNDNNEHENIEEKEQDKENNK